jgi:hypothetical protein
MLRTVSFADEKVKELLRRHFILVWSAYEAHGMVAVRDSFTQAEMAGTPLGFGSRNVRMFIAAPDGTALAQLGGFWTPEHLAPFLDFARALDAAGAKQSHLLAATEMRDRAAAEKDAARRQPLEILHALHRAAAEQGTRPIETLLKEAARAVQMQGC